MKNKLYKKLISARIWKRVYTERVGEPIIYNIISLFVFLFGSYRQKISYDLVPRQPYAFGIDLAFEKAARIQTNILLIEFGVANGAGLLNMAEIAEKLSRKSRIDFKVIGFDTGKGMPPPVDWRDHPEKYKEGDFPIQSKEQLIKRLPKNTKIYFGNIRETLRNFLDDLPSGYKIGFIAVDVDYYSSTKDCLKILGLSDADKYLPSVPMYFDDVNNIDHNEYCGELLAIKEFNEQSGENRKISKMTQLRNWRLFKHAIWIDQMYFGHIFDSKYRAAVSSSENTPVVLTNPYLD